MRLYKRGETYWFELDFKGKQYRKTTRSKNQRVAAQIMSAYHTALVKGEVGILDRKAVPTLRDAMRSFLAWSLQEHRAHPATTERYQYSSIPLLGHFRDLALDQMTADQVEHYKLMRCSSVGKTGRRLRPATVNRELACLRAMFNHAIKSNPDLRNPVSKASGVKLLAEDNQQDRVLTYSEEAAYLAHCTSLLRDVATLILETGMRPEEVFTLQALHVDLEQNYLKVLRGKTPAARRRIELTSTSAAVLERRIADAPMGYLFPNERDPSRPITGVQSAHARALRDSKVLRFRPYDLRHTWATRAAEAGVDLITLAAMMGHSRIQMVMRYAHPSQGHQIGAMAMVVEHKATQHARETARQVAAAERKAKSGLQIVPRTA